MPLSCEPVGAGKRVRRRFAALVGLAALSVVVACTGTGTEDQDRTQDETKPTTGSSVGTLDGWRLARTIHVPEHGHMVYADGALWVVSRPLGEFGRLTGATYQIDPASGRVLRRFHKVTGAWPAVGSGALWFNTATVEPGLVTRLDLDSYAVERIRSGTGRRSAPMALFVAGDKVWVGDFAQRGLAELDARTGQVLKRSRPRPDLSGLRGWTTGDGQTFWINVFEAGKFIRFDATTGRPVSAVHVPFRGGGGGALIQRGDILYAAVTGHIYAIDVAAVGSEKVIDDLRLPGSETEYGADPTRLALGFGSLWAVRYDPPELIRIDPSSMHITGRMPVPGPLPPEGEPPRGPWRDVVVAAGSIWVRSPGKVEELVPTR